MVNVEEGEDPVPGKVVKIHDGNTRENRDASHKRLPPVAYTRTRRSDVAPHDEYRGGNGRDRGRRGIGGGMGKGRTGRRKMTETRRVRAEFFTTPTAR